MNILWILFEVAVNVYQATAIILFLHIVLGDLRSRKFMKSPAPVYALVIAIMITLDNYVSVLMPNEGKMIIFQHAFTLIYMIVAIIYAMICLKGSLMNKILYSVISLIVPILAAALGSNIASAVSEFDLHGVMIIPSGVRFVSVLAVQLIVFYLYFLIVKISKSTGAQNDNLQKLEWTLIFSVLFISIIASMLLNVISSSLSSDTNKIFAVIIFVILIAINIVVCYLLIALGKKNEIARENEALKLSHEYNQQYIDNATAEYDTIKKLQHDFKNNYHAIHTLINNGNIDAALNHIESNVKLLETFAVFIKSENPIVNAVINAKFSEAKPFGIDCSCICGTDFKHIDNLDLCRLLSNMLENAVTACKHSKHLKPSIMLSLMCDDDAYSISLKNTIDSSVLDANPHLLTTKNDRNEHGYGIKIIKEIASKYDGYCDFYEENGMFCCKVILNKLNPKAGRE